MFATFRRFARGTFFAFFRGNAGGMCFDGFAETEYMIPS
jgi:hypothetical protein